jgi:hypothetical protein
VRRTREVEEMCALDLVQLQRPRERLQDAVRDAGRVAALEARVVVDADSGEEGATSSRRSPGTRRWPPKVRSPACSGVIFARLEVRNSRISVLASTGRA